MYVDSQQPPWRAIRAFRQDNGALLVHLHIVSGGVLGGDSLALRIDAGPRSSVQITTTSATRLYRHREGLPESMQETTIDVGDEALVEYLPDALIPFAGSRHRQQTVVRLGSGSRFFWWESLAPGRQAMGEAFAYGSLSIQTEVRAANRPLLIENMLLDPARRPLASLARMGPYTHCANFYAFDMQLAGSKWGELEAQLTALCGAASTPGDMMWGSSLIAAHGIVVRGLSISARRIPATLAAVWTMTRRFLTGEEPALPRKVY